MAVTAPARTSLAVLPTPLLSAPRLADALGMGGSLLVKRDDLTGFAVAGNKARQLEFLLAEAVEQGADLLVTGGTIGSNFVAAAAAAAAYAGLGCVVVLAGDPVDHAAHPNLAAATAWGARPRWTGAADRASVDDLLPRVAEQLASEGARPYVVPRGGANATGALGYRLAVDEVVGQLEGRIPTVVIPVGAGGTLAGLVAGVVAHGRPFRVVGASVSRSVGDVEMRVLDLAQQVARRCGDEPPQARDVILVDARGPGHGVASPAGDAAAAHALRCAGLVLDPVYTAKALAVLASAVPEGPALFWHTGGLLDAVAGLVGPR
jgi:1-aminocyclopropane-1-carboxylate deaminase/D-cysteine desulfhydrase-like pyridoxal-dependent ACC family enzyme